MAGPLNVIAKAAMDYFGTPGWNGRPWMIFTKRQGFARIVIDDLKDAGFVIVRSDPETTPTVTHLHLRDGTVRCGAVYPARHSTPDLHNVTCQQCLQGGL